MHRRLRPIRRQLVWRDSTPSAYKCHNRLAIRILERTGASSEQGLGAGRPLYERTWGSQAIVEKPDIGGNPDDLRQADGGVEPRALVSLLFAPGRRPDAAAIEALAAGGAFAVSHRPACAEAGPTARRWLELLTTGLTFDLSGLAPGAPAEPFAFAHRYGLGSAPDTAAAETVTLAPGPHLAGAEGLLPVVRAAAGLAMALAALPGTLAVGWRPARALSAPAHFTSSVGTWLAGGAFPALGLTALHRSPGGAMTSEGLALLTGQELWLEPAAGSQPADDARLAVRLIDRLISLGPVRAGMMVEPIAGQKVRLEFDPGAQLVRARRVRG